MDFTSAHVHIALTAALALAAPPGCTPSARDGGPTSGPASAPPWFADVTDEVGLDFVHEAGTVGDYFMPEIMGSGAALLDFDGDGRLDIYLIQNEDAPEDSGAARDRPAARNRLYRQGGDGRFADVTDASGLGVAGRGMGVAVGDVTNDGRPDVLVTEYGGARLFLNRSGETFDDVTRAAGIDNPFWGTSAAFFDFDRDGWLDIIIANYVVYSPTRPCSDQAGQRDYCGPAPFPGSAARLFRNLGATPGEASSVRFRDVTVASGLGELSGPGLGVICADFDGDRWPDIFIANDGKPNFLWINRRDGTFAEEALYRGVALNAMGQAQADMGIAIGDVDGDALFDLYVTHLTDELHVLWKQGPRGQFTDRTAVSGLARPSWRSTGFGTVMGDFDHDGALDLAQVNGRVKFLAGPSPPGTPFWNAYAERNQLFANDGNGVFRDVSRANDALCGTPAVGRALAVGDVDGDGALDLLVTVVEGRARLYRNVAPSRGHWLMVRAVEPALGGRDAHGAEITVIAGSRRWARLIQPAASYLSSNDPRAHFGLGDVARVDRIEVIWPDGSEAVFPGTDADRVVVLERGNGGSR